MFRAATLMGSGLDILVEKAETQNRFGTDDYRSVHRSPREEMSEKEKVF